MGVFVEKTYLICYVWILEDYFHCLNTYTLCESSHDPDKLPTRYLNGKRGAAQRYRGSIFKSLKQIYGPLQQARCTIHL